MEIEENPFRKEGRVEAAMAEVEKEQEAKEAAASEEPAEKGEEAEEAPGEEFFADESEDLEGDEDAGEEDIFAESEEEEGEKSAAEKGKKDIPRVPKTRLDKVISQRNGLRDENQALRAESAELKGKVEVLEKLNVSFQERYSLKPELLEYDHDFMEGMEALSKTDPAVARIAAQVDDYIKTGRKPAVEKTPAKSEEKAAPVADSLTKKVLERDVRRTITDTLVEKGFKQNYARLAADDMIAAQGIEALIDIDEDGIKAGARKFVKSKGFTRDEVLKAVEKSKAKATKPASGGSAKPADGAAAPEGSDKDKPKFKSIEELRADRQKRFAGLAKEFGLAS